MKTLLVCSAALLFSTSAFAAECVRTPAGRTVCRGAEGAVVGAPAAATVVEHPAATSQVYPSGVRTVEGAAGAAAYNPRTGNAAVSQTNARGVTTTETRYGGEAKTKNGMGVVQGPGGKTCAKGRGEAKCN